MTTSIATTALLVIDVQMAFVERDKHGIPRSTPSAEGNIGLLLERFRKYKAAVIRVHQFSGGGFGFS